ncbi:hypothetical protein SLE2022_397770 [Rubroshorea leprosula]
MRARIPTSASYIWRSIMASRESFVKGGIWRFYNRRRVNVWRDNWTPDRRGFKPFSFPNVIPPYSTVSSLIDYNQSSWNVELVRLTFSPGEVECILQIPLLDVWSDDIFVWYHNPSGHYTVKSGYWLLQQLRDADIARPSSSTASTKELWKEI